MLPLPGFQWDMRVFSREKCNFYTGDDKPASWGGGDDSHLKMQVITFWLDLPHPILRIPSEENEGLSLDWDPNPTQNVLLYNVILLLSVILEGAKSPSQDIYREKAGMASLYEMILFQPERLICLS